MTYSETLQSLIKTGNFRSIPAAGLPGVADFSSNDYLGLAENEPLRRASMEYALERRLPLSASASRLLAAHQEEFILLENTLSDLYEGRPALVFNSGYHANTGIIGALADKRTLVVADRLVHASIIDGIALSRAEMARFPHNDLSRAAEIIERRGRDFDRVLVVVESVYSMDGDSADIRALAALKSLHPETLLYVDEAHAFGVCGPQGRGLVAEAGCLGAVDVVVGTFGKALASVGAFAVTSPTVRDYLVNKARSLIFSTALPPVNAAFSRLAVEHMLGCDDLRLRLRMLSRRLAAITGSGIESHIQPYIVGDAARTVALSHALLEGGVKVLPIRTPTVPPGTERLRFSLSAALSDADMDRLEQTFNLCRQNS